MIQEPSAIRVSFPSLPASMTRRNNVAFYKDPFLMLINKAPIPDPYAFTISSLSPIAFLIYVMVSIVNT